MPDEQLERLYPQLVAIVEVKLKSGQSYKQQIDAVRGTVLNPMTRDRLSGSAEILWIRSWVQCKRLSSSMRLSISNRSITSARYDDCCSEARGDR